MHEKRLLFSNEIQGVAIDWTLGAIIAGHGCGRRPTILIVQPTSAASFAASHSFVFNALRLQAAGAATGPTGVGAQAGGVDAAHPAPADQRSRVAARSNRVRAMHPSWPTL